MKMYVIVLMMISVLSFPQEKTKQEHMQVGGFKELRAFHDVLHPLVHESLPDNDFTTIKKSLDTLLTRATALQKGKLPKELAVRKEEFDRKSGELVMLLKEMVAMKDTVHDAMLEKQFNAMHETFEELAGLMR